MTETKEMSDEGKRLDKINNYKNIIIVLENLKYFLSKEQPPPLFELVESKIRAYGRKLMRLKNGNNTQGQSGELYDAPPAKE